MRSLITIAAICAVSPAYAADGEPEAQAEPYHLVRALRTMQDRVAVGDEQAHGQQRAVVEQIGQKFLTADAEVWKDRRNIRAAIVYALSGGDPRVLKDAMTKFVLSETDDKLWRGAIAYAEGRRGEAAQLLLDFDAREFEPMLGGHLALVQGILSTRKDQYAALRLLDTARLLAPATLIEEAALRRQTTLLAATGDLDTFEQRSIVYLRKFGRSLYIEGFLQNFAKVLTTTPDYGKDGPRLVSLQGRIEQLDDKTKRKVYLVIAEEAIARGRIALTRMAARRAAELVAEGSPASFRVKVYEAAAKVVTDEMDRGIAALKAIDRATLEESDQSLLDAALALAAEIRKPALEGPIDAVPASQVRLRAQQAISQVDEYIPR